MIFDDEASEMNPEKAASVLEIKGEIIMPSPVRDGIVDVLSFRGFSRAVQLFSRQSRKEGMDIAFERALVKTINLNGAMARVFENGRR